MTQTLRPSLRQEQAFECPKCRQYNLIRSDNPNVYFLCPNPAFGYVVWAVSPEKASPTPENE
jgi:hypothetical protein